MISVFLGAEMEESGIRLTAARVGHVEVFLVLSPWLSLSLLTRDTLNVGLEVQAESDMIDDSLLC